MGGSGHCCNSFPAAATPSMIDDEVVQWWTRPVVQARSFQSWPWSQLLELLLSVDVAATDISSLELFFCLFLGFKAIIWISSVINVCSHSRLCFLNVQCIDCNVLPVFLTVNAPSFKVNGEEKSNNHSMVPYCCRLSFAVVEGTVCGRAELLYF